MSSSASIATTVTSAPGFVEVEQVEDLLKLQKAAQKITSILDLDQLINKVVHHVAQSFGCLEANIYLHDEARGEMVTAATCGCTKHEKGFALKVGKEGLVGHVAATGHMRYAPDVRKDPYYIACEESTLSEVAIPMHVHGKLVGVFTASHPELDGFPREQLRLLQALCTHVAVARCAGNPAFSERLAGEMVPSVRQIRHRSRRMAPQAAWINREGERHCRRIQIVGCHIPQLLFRIPVDRGLKPIALLLEQVSTSAPSRAEKIAQLLLSFKRT